MFRTNTDKKIDVILQKSGYGYTEEDFEAIVKLNKQRPKGEEFIKVLTFIIIALGIIFVVGVILFALIKWAFLTVF